MGTQAQFKWAEAQMRRFRYARQSASDEADQAEATKIPSALSQLKGLAASLGRSGFQPNDDSASVGRVFS